MRIGHVIQPSSAGLIAFEQCQVGEETAGGCAVPVDDFGRYLDDISWMDRMCRLPADLHEACSDGDEQYLPEIVAMPSRARARRKGDRRGIEPRRPRGGDQSVEVYAARKARRRGKLGDARIRCADFDVHPLVPFVGVKGFEGDSGSRHSRGPPGIECQMRRQRLNLCVGDAVGPCQDEMVS